MSVSQQPTWKFIGNLGDAGFPDYDGYLIYEDETGQYAPEGEYVRIDEDGTATVHRFSLEKCTFIDGILSDNSFHPDFPVWFYQTAEERISRPQDSGLHNVASYTGQSEEELIAALTSDDILLRARAYEDIGSYFGFDNFDSYPLELSAAEVSKRYSNFLIGG